MIDELKLIHYGLLRSTAALGLFGADSEVRRLAAAAPSCQSVRIKGAHRRPKRIDSRDRSIARRFTKGTQAFGPPKKKKRA
jgi:hypothetical protein